jgi:glycosyltransferase involved in cell wall biosynthesis
MKDLSIIIPAYNEENRIGKTLSQLGKYFKNKKIDIEILVVVNNTTDNTVEIVKKYKEKYPFIKYTNIRKAIGKGGAISVGLRKATGKYIGFMDADGASTPAEVLRLYKKIISNDKDVVIASRYMKESQIKGELPVYRIIFSRIFNLIVKLLFGLNYKDTQCGLKIFKREVAQGLSRKIISNKWTIDINLLLICKYLGYSVAEIPSIWTAKEGSTLKTSKAIIEVPQELIALKKAELKYFIKKDGHILDSNPTLSYKALIH